MYTQCPECLTVFSLDADALAPAGGHVQCGHCDQVFDALACLVAQLPPEPFTRLAPPVAAGSPPRLELAVYRPRPEPAAVVGVDAPATPSGDDFGNLVFTPRFARGGRAARSGERGSRRDTGERRWPWVLVCLALAATLGAQLAWAQRNVLLADPDTGPWLRQACSALGCRLPLVSRVDQLRLIARDVEAHPSVPGALMISATVRNEAPFTQPYPVVSLVLADAQGRRVAMRRLRPSEYLDDNESLRAGMAPGATTALVLEVEDPGNKAVAFEFGFE
ncbi:zinc-ribbon and DUF3426 domain-containing protein [Dyella sp.]|jgi:predicted Zn finger-like uncharacterized protein|uniref:zinc-ribbon and DUF3426 domain-containing protein n=1 Tax=Dyella sp. TaxID=1869338 RepID=UPI002D79B485|nr:zinc-ribbon and DUF3426 domain-containing protein [Dyella sp.]HET6433438.1 zinc-ribbon and DUF3426 domain-containing protein [Dyella sp.]